MSRACDVCGASLDGRRPDARTCSPACRRKAARAREEAANAEPGAPSPTADPCRAHVCEARLARLEQRLDEYGPRLLSVEARLLARIIRDALREEPGR